MRHVAQQIHRVTKTFNGGMNLSAKSEELFLKSQQLMVRSARLLLRGSILRERPREGKPRSHPKT